MSKLFWIGIMFLAIISCREDFLLESGNDPVGLNLFGEINPGEPVSVSLLESYNFGFEGEFNSPEDAVIFLTGSDLTASKTSFVFDRSRDKYMLRNMDFRVKEGQSYQIVAYIPESPFDTLMASTSLPPASSIREFEVIDREVTRLTSQADYHLLTLRFRLAEAVIQPAYFQVIPSRFKSQFRINDRGEMIITDSNQSEDLVVLDILNNRNAIFEFEHKKGIFIDDSRLEDRDIIIQVRSATGLLRINEIINLLRFEVRTLSRELYEYHQFLNNQVVSDQTDLSYPVNSFSNVKNGKGVFGAYSMRTHILPVK